jgi:hypothetical protein
MHAQILVEGGDAQERVYAQQILPIRLQGNLLLCTLLLGNVIINSALSILLADLTTGPIGLLTSTAIILIFGKWPQLRLHGILCIVASSMRRPDACTAPRMYLRKRPMLPGRDCRSACSQKRCG